MNEGIGVLNVATVTWTVSVPPLCRLYIVTMTSNWLQMEKTPKILHGILQTTKWKFFYIQITPQLCLLKHSYTIVLQSHILLTYIYWTRDWFSVVWTLLHMNKKLVLLRLSVTWWAGVTALSPITLKLFTGLLWCLHWEEVTLFVAIILTVSNLPIVFILRA